MKPDLNIVADENISFAQDAFSGFGKVFLINGRSISPGILKNADVLIVRSVTKVDKSLIDGTDIKFVGTATTGTDHIDIEFLREKGIHFASASGCNADAVAEYVITAIIRLSVSNNFSLKDKVLGVIGVGNIGSRVARIGKSLGMKVILNDLPLFRQTGNEIFRPLEELFEADIITFHVPLNLGGPDTTYHLFDRKELLRLKDRTVIINTSRGEVINNNSLQKFIKHKNFKVVLDVWENEPEINKELLKEVIIGTPHIAGYSVEGKVNGTVMVYNSLSNFLGVKPEWKPVLPEVENKIIIPDSLPALENIIDNIIKKIYDIQADDFRMRKILSAGTEGNSEYFDKLRKTYPYRREFNNYKVDPGNNNELKEILNALRFKIKK